MSTYVQAGAPGQYHRPLILLPTTTLPLKCNTFGAPGMQPSDLYPVTNMQVIPVPAWHVNTPLIKPSALSSKDYLPPAILLRSDASEQNLEPPKPEKPKWEEEQYPDIGKSNEHLEYLS